MARLKCLLDPPRIRLKSNAADQISTKPGKLQRLFPRIMAIRENGKPSCMALGNNGKMPNRLLRTLRLEILRCHWRRPYKAEHRPLGSDIVGFLRRASVRQGFAIIHKSKGRLLFHSPPCGKSVAHVNLAGDGGGDQRGPAFLQQVDGALGFGG